MIPSARKLKSGWSYLAGEKGTNRVRVYAHRCGNLFAEYMEDGRKVRRSLRHNDPKRAKREAEALAVELSQPRKRLAANLGQLFDNYLREVTPTKSPTTQKHDKTTIGRFRAFFGESVPVEELTHRDAARYERVRRKGGDQRPRKGSGGKVRENNPHKIRSRSVAYDLKVIRAVFNWGVGARLIDRNPFAGYKVKEDGSPNRPSSLNLSTVLFSRCRTSCLGSSRCW